METVQKSANAVLILEDDRDLANSIRLFLEIKDLHFKIQDQLTGHRFRYRISGS